MTDDLERRLRERPCGVFRESLLHNEAADELARLRAALGDAFETLTYIHAASECEQSRRAAKEAADKIEAALKGPSHE